MGEFTGSLGTNKEFTARLTRNQGGMKGLYYGHNGDTLYFSSEHAALLVPTVDQIHEFPAGYYYSSVKGLGPCPNFVNR